MKKILVLLIAAIVCSATGMAQKVKEIQPKKLPDISLRTLATYFDGKNVTQAMTVDDKMDRHYEVSLDDGTIIHFDKQGVWKLVKACGESLPQRMVPGMINMYLQKNKIEVVKVME